MAYVPWWVPKVADGETPDGAAVLHTVFSGIDNTALGC